MHWHHIMLPGIDAKVGKIFGTGVHQAIFALSRVYITLLEKKRNVARDTH